MNTYTFNVRDFNLKHIFDCGQCFRWREMEDGSYMGVARGRMANISFREGSKQGTGNARVKVIIGAAEDPSGLSSERKLWREYLDLDRDYGEIKAKLTRHDNAMKAAVNYGYGIRILKQDLWETIISFIISQNNNIPRIKGCIEGLAENFGEPLEGISRREARGLELPGGIKPYKLPSVRRLARLSKEDLAPIKLGYRDKYLIETARIIEERGLPESDEELEDLCGVGPKVANCISLFGLGKVNSFPVDVWVKRVMNRMYDFREDDIAGMVEYAAHHFGDLSGFAQQYLFYYIRGLDG